MISGLDYLTITSINVTNQQLLADPFLATTPGKGKIRKTPSEYLINDVKHLGNIGSASGRSSDASSLSGLLVTMVQEELSDCRLVLVYDASDLYSVVVKELLMLLPNHPKQVVEVNGVDDLLGVVWVSTGCGGYLLLLDHPQPLLTFANTHHHTWDYHGRYVFVSQRVEQVEALVATRNGKKTEHILGVVKGGQEGEWRVYMNMLYWGEGVRPVTTWRHHRFTSQSQLFPDKLDDLQGAVLKVSSWEMAPTNMYYRAENGSLLFRYGEDIAVTELLAYVLNFTILYAEPADGNRWGWQENNTWTGFMGELFRDEADIGLANLYIMINRMGAIEFSAPFSDDRSCFMVKMEEPLPRWHALAYPYHPWTWLAILVGFILSGPVLFLLATASSQCGDETTSLAKLGYSWGYSSGCHFQEPQTAEPRMDSTRIFVMFLWLYTMILSIVYSTNLTAFLLVTKTPTSIQTMEEIYQSGRELATFGFTGAGWLKTHKLLPQFQGYTTEKEIFTRVMEKNTVYWLGRAYLNFHIVTRYTVRGEPQARILKECFMAFNIAMGLQQHSPLKRKFDQVIGWIRQSGIIHHAVREALRLAATTKEYGGGDLTDSGEAGQVAAETGTVLAFNMDHMQGAFMVAAIGWFTAITVFILETLFLQK
ncbi:hypothetical protein Pcinc_020900 [Petrolisthes cinctipes]|uniref:Uncharacterized protein n=1 Tax=Petrolisthes cinctipes TaxID=88211 RepID=A0AAE1FGY5_PETCI|nr:hypothetical protein Pcinc_020900 [Petrolisthes cinctipes]